QTVPEPILATHQLLVVPQELESVPLYITAPTVEPTDPAPSLIGFDLFFIPFMARVQRFLVKLHQKLTR
ncbi:hypothetical protein ABTD45_19815, partial [Acinetobacter baumannii]